MDVSEAQRLRALEDENRRLKLLVAETQSGRRSAEGSHKKKRLELPPHGIKFQLSVDEKKGAGHIVDVGGLVCANVSGLFVELELLAMMESARRWSTKWVELSGVLIATQT
jgi:hypothetical protein